MSAFRNLLIACSLVLSSAGFAQAEECGPREINGKKYTCCKTSTQKVGPACDANVKVGEALRCNEKKTETKYECTEVSEKKPENKPEKKAENKSENKK